MLFVPKYPYRADISTLRRHTSMSLTQQEIVLIVFLVIFTLILGLLIGWLWRCAQRRKRDLGNTHLSPEAQKAADKMGGGWTKPDKHSKRYTKVDGDDVESGKTEEKTNGKTGKDDGTSKSGLVEFMFMVIGTPIILVASIFRAVGE